MYTFSLCVAFSGQCKHFTTACLAVGLTQVVAQSNGGRDHSAYLRHLGTLGILGTGTYIPTHVSCGGFHVAPLRALQVHPWGRHTRPSRRARLWPLRIRFEYKRPRRELKADQDSSSQPTRHYLGNNSLQSIPTKYITFYCVVLPR